MTNYTKLISFVVCSFWASVLQAQVGQQQIGLLLGQTTYQGDIPDPSHQNLTYGVFYKRSLSTAWSLRPSLVYTSIVASDLNLPSNSEFAKRAFSFETKLVALAFNAQWNVLSSFSKRAHRLSPYVYGGASLLWMDANPDFSRNNQASYEAQIRADLDKEISQIQAGLNFGAGLDLQVTRKLHLFSEFSLHPIPTDYLDGISKAGNPAKNDNYYTIKVGVALQWSQYDDGDSDGVPDHIDACPTIAGSSKANGCPDRDGDGIEDRLDQCPDVVGTKRVAGCPDYDGDGVADGDDLCPQVVGDPRTAGCPAVDSDQDGIIDAFDQCPDEAGTREYDGCLPKDADNDGIENNEDDCPTVFGDAIFNGCPDTDGDGIQDKKDLCPLSFGLYQYKGCSNEEEVADFLKEIKNLQMPFDTALGLTEEQNKELDDLVKVLTLYPGAKIHIVGTVQQSEYIQQYFMNQSIEAQRVSIETLKTSINDAVQLEVLELK